MAISSQRQTRLAALPRRLAVIIIAIVCALAVNLVIYATGRAAGGSFTYTQSGRTSTVDAVAVAFLSVGPLTVGLALVALLSQQWPVLINAAKVASPALALVTIALMTIPADFDTTSTLFLATMHLTLISVSLIALTAFARRP